MSTRSHSIAQASLNSLWGPDWPQSPSCWDYRHSPPHPTRALQLEAHATGQRKGGAALRAPCPHPYPRLTLTLEKAGGGRHNNAEPGQMGRWLPPAERNSPTADASLTHVAIKARLQGHPQNTRHLGLRGQTNHVWGGWGQKYREATSHQATEQALNQLSVFCFGTGTSSQEPVPRREVISPG